MLNSNDIKHEMPKTLDMKAYALFYAGIGIPVFPLKPGTKDAYYCDTEHRGAPTKKYPTGNPFSWPNQASKDPEQVEQMWTEHPEANIGLVTGNGLYVVDVDIREDGNGFDSLEKWEREGVLPDPGKVNLDTWTVTTGSGGKQFFYYLPEDLVKICREKRINLSGSSGMIEKDSHIDTRGDGRYVVAPPSIHPNGERYKWEDNNPETCPIAPMDKAIEYIFRHPGKKKGSRKLKEYEFNDNELIPYGSRYDYLVAKAGQFVAKNIDIMSDEAIVSALMSTARTNLSQDPPIDYEELEKKMRYTVSEFRHKDNEKKQSQIQDNAGSETTTGTQDQTERVKPTYYKAPELAKAVFPPNKWIIEDFLKEGLIVLSAKSKIGKSWLCGQIGLSVSRGEDFLGFKTDKGKVLYIDLENGDKLGQERLLLQTGGKDYPDDLTMVFEYSTMKDYFYEDLEEYVSNNPGTKVIIIDVLKKVWKSKKSNQSDDDYVYENLTPLKDFAKEHNLAIIAVTHNRKNVDPDDPCSNICGSNAYVAVADETIVIWKDKRTDSTAHMFITGRTVTQEEYYIDFNKNTYLWDMVGTADDIEDRNRKMLYEENPVVITIRNLVERSREHRFTAKVSEIIKLSEGLIATEPKETGGIIKTMLPLLKKYDNIGYSRVTNGNGSAPYTFYRISDTS